MTATAAAARYQVAKGTLALTGEQGLAPRVDNDRIAVEASQLDITLAGPLVSAAGTVKSTLKPPKKAADGADRAAARAPTYCSAEPVRVESGSSTQAKVPTMLRNDQDVTVTANRLEYDGTQSRATYTGDARLYQGETTIKGETIIVDDKNGNLAASGGDQPVATSMIREQVTKAKATERVPSTAVAKSLKYDDATRRLTYEGQAHMSGPDGDMAAARIELYLMPSGDEIERVEAYEQVTLVEQSGRKTTGNRMTYVSAEEQYMITGTPVVVLDPCGRETRGRTLTMYKATDRIVVDGNTRTQTRSGSSCP
jgi:lipopolysaccharide export system protein LptA